MVLAGGSTPKRLYAALAREADLSFDNWELYFGDERWVGQDHDDSNHKMAKGTLLDPADISDDKVFPMVTTSGAATGASPGAPLGEPAVAAKSYDELLQQLVTKASADAPIFDVVLLGMGDDGHTASLFPGTSALNAAPGELCVSTWVEAKNTHRVSLTFEALSRTQDMLILVTGAGKREMISKVWALAEPNLDYPVSAVATVSESNGKTWLVDAAAAGNLDMVAADG